MPERRGRSNRRSAVHLGSSNLPRPCRCRPPRLDALDASVPRTDVGEDVERKFRAANVHHHRGDAEVGQRDLVTDDELVPAQVRIQKLREGLEPLVTPVHLDRSRRGGLRQELLPDEVCEDRGECGLPVGRLPKQPARDVGPPLRVARPQSEIAVGLGQVLEDCVRLPQREIAVDQRRDLAPRIDRQVLGRAPFTLVDVDELDLGLEPEVAADGENLQNS